MDVVQLEEEVHRAARQASQTNWVEWMQVKMLGEIALQMAKMNEFLERVYKEVKHDEEE